MQLREIAEIVSSLKPGEEISFPFAELRGVPPLEHNGARCSAYGWTVFEDFARGRVIFQRRTVPDGARSYVAPDRRDWFDLRPDGFYWPKPEPSS